jgi:predicted DNA-binding transcriptional regulator YafY
MSYKFDSLMIILNKLDRNELVTVHSLMDELEISERSVHRYLQTLQVAGFPIHFDKKKGSYCFVEGYSLKRPNFSVEEVLAFALAKDALKNFGIDMEESLDSLEEKLAIKQPSTPGQIILKPQKPSAVIEGYLGKIYKAITNFQRIEITYKALYSNEESKRKLDPYYIFFPNGFWTLRAYCHLRKALRTFAFDRIISLKVLNEHFPPRNMPPEEELSSSFGAWLDAEIENIVLRFDGPSVPLILRRKWHQSQKVRELKDGRIEVSFRVNGLKDIKPWIYRWIPHVEVIRPKKLKDTIKQDLKQAVKKV